MTEPKPMKIDGVELVPGPSVVRDKRGGVWLVTEAYAVDDVVLLDMVSNPSDSGVYVVTEVSEDAKTRLERRTTPTN